MEEAAVSGIPCNLTFGEFMVFTRAEYFHASLYMEHVFMTLGTMKSTQIPS